MTKERFTDRGTLCQEESGLQRLFSVRVGQYADPAHAARGRKPEKTERYRYRSADESPGCPG